MQMVALTKTQLPRAIAWVAPLPAEGKIQNFYNFTLATLIPNTDSQLSDADSQQQLIHPCTYAVSN